MDLGTQAGFTATLTIPDRKEYGLVWNKSLDQGGMMLGDDVAITLNVAAFSPSAGGPGAATKK
jgi:polyisoprenoid-binding protein YceI